jgi:biotin transport system permease protein
MLSVAAFLPWLWVLPVISAVLIALSLSAGLRPWELLRGAGPLALFVLAVFFFQALNFTPRLHLDPGGLKSGVIFALRISLSFASGALLFMTTTQTEIKRSLSRLERSLHIERLHLSLALSLMLGFIPRFFEVWEDVNLAWDARSGRKGILRIAGVLPLVIEGMMEKAAEIAEALDAKGIY